LGVGPAVEAWKKEAHFQHYACLDLDALRKQIEPKARLARSARYDVLELTRSGHQYTLDHRFLEVPIIPKGEKFYLLKVNKTIRFNDRDIVNLQDLSRWFGEEIDKAVVKILGGSATIYVVTQEVLDVLLAADPSWIEFDAFLKQKVLEKATCWSPEQLDFMAGRLQVSSEWDKGAQYLRSEDFKKTRLVFRGLNESLKVNQYWQPIATFVALLGPPGSGLGTYRLYQKYVPIVSTRAQGEKFEHRVKEFKRDIKTLQSRYPLLHALQDIYIDELKKVGFKHVSLYIQTIDSSSEKGSFHDYSI